MERKAAAFRGWAIINLSAGIQVIVGTGKSMEPREHAEKLARYFERVAREYGSKEVWEKGQATAAEWLRLIEAEGVSDADVSAFLRMVHANRYRSSGWFELAWGVYRWVESKGIQVPPVEEFFASEVSFLRSGQFTLSVIEQAQILKDGFQQKCNEDPASEAWAEGARVIDEWAILLERPERTKADVVTLVESVQANYMKFSSRLWHNTMLALSVWCKEIGYPALIPEDFRDVVGESKREK